MKIINIYNKKMFIKILTDQPYLSIAMKSETYYIDFLAQLVINNKNFWKIRL